MNTTIDCPVSTGIASAELREKIEGKLNELVGRRWDEASPREITRALACVVREPLLRRGWDTEERCRVTGAKRVAYLSLEFLVGRCLRSNLAALGWTQALREVLEPRGLGLEDLFDEEAEPALGNGGLGRLAACFLESLATLALPATGYGILYDYGLFRQEIRQGWQRERPDRWNWEESPWLIGRPEHVVWVPIYGRVEHSSDRDGHYNPMWVDWRLLAGMPFDLPVAGFGTDTVQYLRLYAARASEDFDISIFNAGDYIRAVEQKIASESVSKVLYPADEIPQGKELRLIQEYFLVACAIRDLIRRHLAAGAPIDTLPERLALQMNDTHPALSVAELMRVLIDEHGIPWDQAWQWTQSICGYTNHTLMSEALESWPLELMERVLPRHVQIIFEINHRFLTAVRQRWPGDEARARRMSIITEDNGRRVRMANLAVVGSHAVNGVSALHSRLVAESLMPDFSAFWPERFQNKTNGVTHRRWLMEINPELSALVTSFAGDGWGRHPELLEDFQAAAEDGSARQGFLLAKRHAKERLAAHASQLWGLRLDPAHMFDVQVKRIHQYKRQLLNALAILSDYLRITEDGWNPPVPRVSLFAGKAAPSYQTAKLIIRFINAIAAEIRGNTRASKWLQVAFLPDYRVSLAERIIPAADLSEQISTAGTEASGTGNMKLALNGALTIGTLDGANVEIREAAGADNFFLFGLTTPEVQAIQANRSYQPHVICASNDHARRIVEVIRDRNLGGCEPSLFQPILDEILSPTDPYLHLADLDSYLEARSLALRVYVDQPAWAARAIHNIAAMGRFSSDRTIAEYARDIWGIQSLGS
jgi:glycogen phosphorylase